MLIQEAMMTGIDSLGFDLRVCCETQVQTLRFGFNTRVCHIVNAQLIDQFYSLAYFVVVVESKKGIRQSIF